MAFRQGCFRVASGFCLSKGHFDLATVLLNSAIVLLNREIFTPYGNTPSALNSTDFFFFFKASKLLNESFPTGCFPPPPHPQILPLGKYSYHIIALYKNNSQDVVQRIYGSHILIQPLCLTRRALCCGWLCWFDQHLPIKVIKSQHTFRLWWDWPAKPVLMYSE